MGAHPIFAFSDRLVDDLVARKPLLATSLGIPGSDDRWDDLSPDGHREIEKLLRQARKELETLPPAGEDRADLAVAVAGDLLDLELQTYEIGDHLRDIAHVASVFDDLRDVFDQMDRSTAEGWHDICGRLETIDEPLTGWRASLAEGLQQGLRGQQRQVLSVIEQMRAASTPQGALGGMPGMFAASPVEDGDLAARVDRATTRACEAVAAAADDLEQRYLPEADPDDGVGEERYLVAARRHLGMQLDPLEAYAWAWEHLAELRERIRAVARRIDPDRDLDGVAELLKTDPDRAADGQEAFRRTIQERLQAAMRDLEGEHFDIPAEIRQLDVRTAAPGTPPGAWYIPPSEDLSRPGAAWWSFGDKQHIPLYEEISTAYHEGFPGHHLQVGLQVLLSDRLSRLHRLLYWNPGYGEGWALYAERLMDELGYLDRPEYEFGQLTGSLLRAVRVVVDLGNHLRLPIPEGQPFHPGEPWSYELGVEMLQRDAFLDPDYAASEMTRYLGWPAQAISYKLGERVLLELREELRRRDGDRFDLRAFHDRVLTSGPVGLDLLRRRLLGSPAQR